MSNGEQATGISDSRYELVSVLYHALQGGHTYVFKEVQRQDAERGKKAKELLGERWVVTHEREGRFLSSSKEVPMDAIVISKNLVRDRFRAVIPVRIVEISEERRVPIPH